MSNLLKRKNDDESSSTTDTKRVALDSEQLELAEKQEESSHIAPSVRPDLPKAESNSNSNTLPTSKPVVGPKQDDDSTTVSIRMYCPVKEAGIIVGKKGDTISHIREKANVRIYVSENLKNVPERVVSVKGSGENVARAFGLITRTILDEPEDEPASIMSKLYSLKLLVPHPMVGYIIGKGGSKFREIEENSAAKLKAADQPLPYSTDRVLTVTGVADAIHIAIYYISQVMLDHRDCLKKHRIVFYNPANFRPPVMMGLGNYMNNMGNMNSMGNMNNMGNMTSMNMNDMNNMNMSMNMNNMNTSMNMTMMDQAKPYDFLMIFQPAVRPQFNSTNIPVQNLFTDEHGNTIVGDVITQMPVQVSTTPERFTEDVFVANSNIGSVIGRGGNNIKHIRENSGCTYVKIEPDQNQSILLGGGKGMTSVRKLTLTGSYNLLQTAIFLINQRISADKERNGIH